MTKGYYHNPEATAAVFDEDGYYQAQDAVRFLDPDNPAAGLVFDGRTGENFKLTSGVWVHNARLRNSTNALGQPFMLEVVVAAPDRDYLTALVFPNMPALRGRFQGAAEAHPDETSFLQSEAVVNFFRDVFKQHNADHTGSSKRFERFTLLTVPPRIDKK